MSQSSGEPSAGSKARGEYRALLRTLNAGNTRSSSDRSRWLTGGRM